jgi:tRNA-modifying protein YgfZ
MKTQWQSYLQTLNAQFDDQGFVTHFEGTNFEIGQPFWSDLSNLGIIEVSGEDAQTFLQGQFTNDVRQVSLEKSQFTAWCNAKGRVLATFYLYKRENTFYLLLPQDNIAAVLRRLAMYVLRSKVKLREITDETHAIGLSGDFGKKLNFPEHKNSVINQDDMMILCLSGNTPKWIVIASTEKLQNFTQHLDKSIIPVGKSVWELLEILDGIPQISLSTADAFTPHMLNLQLIEGVNFKKGCYSGQEIVSRTQYLGKVKRRIYLAKIHAKCPKIGDNLVVEGEENTAQIVNIAPHPDGFCYVLAVVSNAAVEINNVRSQDNIPLIFLDLPYVVE